MTKFWEKTAFSACSAAALVIAIVNVPPYIKTALLKQHIHRNVTFGKLGIHTCIDLVCTSLLVQQATNQTFKKITKSQFCTQHTSLSDTTTHD